MKKTIVIVLTVMIVFAFASCGNKTAATTEPATQKTSTVAATSTQKAEPATTSTPAATTSTPAATTSTPAATTSTPAATTSTPAATTTQQTAPAASTPSTGTVDSEFDPNKQVEFTQQTNDSNRIVTIGTIDKSKYSVPVFVTSFGQSTDAAMLDTVMKRVGVEYAYNSTASADVIASSGAKTIIIAVGASTKGLGAAGISEAQETQRAEAIMKTVKEKGMEVVFCHIGGSSRRGTLSDVFADMVLAQASYMVLKEDANFDYKFTNFAESNNVPISLIYATKDTINVFTDLFAK